MVVEVNKEELKVGEATEVEVEVEVVMAEVVMAEGETEEEEMVEEEMVVGEVLKAVAKLEVVGMDWVEGVVVGMGFHLEEGETEVH